jgi:hypothetical protein
MDSDFLSPGYSQTLIDEYSQDLLDGTVKRVVRARRTAAFCADAAYEECRSNARCRFPSTAHRFSPLSPKDLPCSRVRNGHPPRIQDYIVEGIIKVV